MLARLLRRVVLSWVESVSEEAAERAVLRGSARGVVRGLERLTGRRPEVPVEIAGLLAEVDEPAAALAVAAESAAPTKPARRPRA